MHHSFVYCVCIMEVAPPPFDAPLGTRDHFLRESPTPKIFALDIGGSLAKLAYERTYRYKRSVPCPLDKPVPDNGLPPFTFYDYQEREHEGRKVCLIKFETRQIEECLEFIRENILQADAADATQLGDTETSRPAIKVTGGGAYRFKDLITRTLGVELNKEDEMECLIRGCIFMLRNIPDELFFYDKHATPAHVFVSDCLVDTFPFLLVNIGSGVSILKVESPTSYSRVGGTSIGGGTFWGIGSILSGGKCSFDQLLRLADQGDHRKVDMLVRDIYGGDYSAMGLQGDVIASSFGLAARSPEQPRCLADAVKSLLITVSNNIGQLACLYAKQHNLTRILFGGFFIRGHGLTMEVITYAVNFWSAGAYRALFLRHEGYLGAMGAFVKALDEWSSTNEPKTVWAENYVSSTRNACTMAEECILRSRQNSMASSQEFRGDSSSELTELNRGLSASMSAVPTEYEDTAHLSPGEPHLSMNSMQRVINSADLSSEIRLTSRTTVLKRPSLDTSYCELDRMMDFSLEPFPFLESPTTYVPDTWDLTQDTEARTYWLDCLKDGVERHRIKAEESQIDSMPDAAERSKQYADRYISYLQELGQNPSSCGVLTVRCLLSAQQHFLREFGFGDAFCRQKKLENRSALVSLPKRLNDLAALPWSERQFALASGLLAGNVFDWGAAEMVRFFAEAPTNSFGVPEMEATLAKIPPRPWLIDDYDKWIEAISPDRRPYRCVLIFCDNSGPDVLLGVLPFALEFISRGSKVILAANSAPAINDVTYQELDILLRLISSHVHVVAHALSSGRLLVAENGQTSPCLDLRLTASSLAHLVKREGVDLVVIEGMGRAIHTNLYARFRVDSLKVAVIKNAWLARRLGGQLYGVVFKFAPVQTICGSPNRENTPTTGTDGTKNTRSISTSTNVTKTHSTGSGCADNSTNESDCYL
ncbi:Type II pantothenate kinase [Fasciola hepatica]|uniref:4'-phosphopantetheine phosphatase n=1 Tax=Fasciola hepatica TaxID=6192 RepID=A0A4E0RZE3_FASHE|nr:Type II pantothenate kinase [Fasciola hepatica]